MRCLIALMLVVVLFPASDMDAGRALAQDGSLLDLLPELHDGVSDVSVTDSGSRSLEVQAAAFSDPEEAARLLTEWGWQENVFQQYENSALPAGETGAPYLYVSLTRFEDGDCAAAALPYLIQDLAAVLGHREIPTRNIIGDESRQFVAPVEGGIDLTLYVRSDALVVRISALMAEGDPIANPDQLAERILMREAAPPTPTAVRESMLPALLETLLPT